MRPYINNGNMNIFPINFHSPYYPSVENLLISSFPADERRDVELQRQYADHHPKFTVYAVCEAEKFVGFFTLWRFEQFSYVEHLAVLKEFRNKGYGTLILQYIKEIITNPLLLEIEIPLTDQQVARKLFYEKNGFSKLDFPYFQPPYRAGGECISMHLMMYGKFNASDDVDFEKKVEQYVAKIYAEVYSFNPIVEA